MIAFASLLLALQATALPAAYLEKSQSLAQDSVVSGLCYSLGWEPSPSANVVLEAELDRLAASHQVLPGLARETLMRQALDVSQAIRADLVQPQGSPTEQLAFLDMLEARAGRDCTDVAVRRTELFKGAIEVNQARVAANFVELRRQTQARIATP